MKSEGFIEPTTNIEYPTSIDNKTVGLPRKINLNQNYPNPFNGTTKIEYSLSQDTNVNLTIYRIDGQLVKVLQKGLRSAGQHALFWNGEDQTNQQVASGIYIYTLETDVSKYSKKLLLLR